MNSQIGPRLVSGVLLLQWGSKAALFCPLPHLVLEVTKLPVSGGGSRREGEPVS